MSPPLTKFRLCPKSVTELWVMTAYPLTGLDKSQLMFFFSKKMMFVLSPCVSLESNNYLCARNWRLMGCKTKMVCMCEHVCVHTTHYRSDSVSYWELTLCTWNLRILGFPREYWDTGNITRATVPALNQKKTNKINVLWIGTWSKVDVVFQDQEQWLSQIKDPTTKCQKSLMN